ncbi:MAG: fumarylacetoacetate hydrolase family protein [Pseudomonadota bacterium]
MKRPATIIASTLALLLAAQSARADEAALGAAIIEANAAGTETPRVSVLDPKIDLDGAYRVQQAVVDHMLEGGDGVAGYKAGLTGKLARWWFDIDDPVFGVIPASGLRRSGDTIGQPKGRHMLLETEIAFVAGARIDKPVADVVALKPLIRGVTPVIEAPAGGFPESQARQLTVTDIVANNVSAHILIVGEEHPADGVDLAKLKAVMKRDGEVVSKGTGADVTGDPWESALWLVNVAIGQGRVIEPGHYLSTGVVGKRVESQPGRYVANFGQLGEIAFEIR